MNTMRNFRLLVVAMTILFGFGRAHAEIQKTKVKKVQTAEQFVQAMKSNSHILIPQGVTIMLTEALVDDDNCKAIGLEEISIYESNYDIYDKKPTLGYYDPFDGPQLILAGMRNITIEGEGTGASIIISPRYSYVLHFIKCRNITLRNLTLGHTEEGYCEGGVVGLYYCDNVAIEHCDMYGCGTEGIGAEHTSNLRCDNSIIRECSYFIMNLSDCKNVEFNACEFHHNKEFPLINVKSSSNVAFNNTYIHDNQGQLFSIQGGNIKLHECEIEHPADKLGHTNKINDDNSKWIPTEEPVVVDEDEVIDDQAVPTRNWDHDWMDKHPLVNSGGQTPGIVDFFKAFAHKSNSPMVRQAVTDMDNPKAAESIIEIDRSNGYLLVGSKSDTHEGQDYKVVEACYWKCDNGHRIFAVNAVIDTEATMVMFYDYDPRTRLLSPLDIIPQRMLTEGSILALPRYGKSMQLLDMNNVDYQLASYTYTGSEFVFLRTNSKRIVQGKALTNSYGVVDLVSYLKRFYPEYVK